MTWAQRWKAIAKQHRRADAPAMSILLGAYRRKTQRMEKLEARVAELEGPTAAVMGRVYSRTDAWLKIAGLADAETFERLLDGHMNVAVIFEHEFERRFPQAHANWMKKHDVD